MTKNDKIKVVQGVFEEASKFAVKYVKSKSFNKNMHPNDVILCSLEYIIHCIQTNKKPDMTEFSNGITTLDS